MSIVFAGTIERTPVPESSLATACSAIWAWGLWAAIVRCCWVSTEASTAISVAAAAMGIHSTTALPKIGRHPSTSTTSEPGLGVLGFIKAWQFQEYYLRLGIS